MSKERLEKAKELVESYEMEFLSNHPIFLDEDIETLIWMLEQAKRAQELERKLADRDYTNGQYIRLLNRHENLREALEFYANSAHYEVEVDYEVYIPESKFIKPQEIVTVDGEIMKDYGSKAREALRGDNHEQTTKG